MKNSTNNSGNNNNNAVATALTGELDATEAFAKIRQVIEENHCSDDGTCIGDEIDQKIKVFEMVIRGIESSCYNGISLNQADCHGILVAWGEVRELLELREKEHGEVWNIAFHGSKEGMKNGA